jgi:hypothetical protein
MTSRPAIPCPDNKLACAWQCGPLSTSARPASPPFPRGGPPPKYMHLETYSQSYAGAGQVPMAYHTMCLGAAGLGFAASLPASLRRSIWGDAMRPAVKIALNLLIKEVTHRVRRQEAQHCHLINFAIVVPSAAQIYEHVRVLFVIADPLDETACRGT